MVLKKKMLKQFPFFHINATVMTTYTVKHLFFQNTIRFLLNC